jgi:hypothetical protein
VKAIILLERQHSLAGIDTCQSLDV